MPKRKTAFSGKACSQRTSPSVASPIGQTYATILGMAKARKSPQQKKDLEYNKDHFTFSNAPHGFPKSWRQKKAQANRQYRRKSEALLAPAKRLISADDAEATAGDITSGHLNQAVARKRLRKMSSVTIGQKVKIKLEKRKESAGRRV